MEIPQDIKKAHERLSKHSVTFLEFVQKDPEHLKRSNYQVLKWPRKYVKFQPWPLFINQHLKNELIEAGRNVSKLVKNIPRQLFAYNPKKISTYFELPLELITDSLKGVTDNHINNLLARGDFVFSPTSGFKCIEFNVSGNLGGWELPFWQSMYLQTPTVSKFFEENNIKMINANLLSVVLEHFIDRMLEKYPHCREEMNMAIVMTTHGDGTTDSPVERYAIQKYNHILQRKNKHLKGELIVCNYPHLRVQGDYLYYGEKKVLAIEENYGGKIPPDILEVFQKGNLFVYNGPITDIMSNKLNIALLSEREDSDVFTVEEREMIKKYIPWTRKTVRGKTTYGGEKIDLEKFVLSHKEKLVLKPALEYGGKGVLIGFNTLEEQWEESVRNAFQEQVWLVQEYIEPYTYLFQEGEEGCSEHNAIWGIFMFGNSYGGCFLRILPKKNNKGIINSRQGADTTIIYEVEE